MIPARKVPEKVVYEDGQGPEPLHDKPFKPSNPNKKGQPGYIAKFPEYLPNPPTELKRVIVSEEEASDKPPGWKATYRGKTRP